MRRMIKKLVSLLLVSLLMLSLCGCTMESARATHGKWSLDYSTITWQDKDYVLLTDIYGEMQPLTNGETYVYVTEADVPLLLRYYLGETMEVSYDEKFLIGWEYIYCRSDYYEEAEALLEQGSEMNGYCFDYWDKKGNYKVYQMHEEQVQIVNTIIAEGTPTEKIYDNLHEEMEWLGDVYACSEDMLFREIAFEVWTADERYYLVLVDENYENVFVYEIPDSQREVVEKIFEKMTLYY